MVGKEIDPAQLVEDGGAEAKALMARLAEGQVIVCGLTGEWTCNRQVGICTRSGRDFGAALIAAGLAWDCPRYSGELYIDYEIEASHRLPFLSYRQSRRA